MLAAERASWQNPRVLTTLLLVFVAGAVAGALSMRLGLHERLHRSAYRGGSLATPEDGNKAFLDKCRKELSLSQQQTQQMAGVLDDYKTYYQSLKEQLEEVRATGKNRILQLLDDRQKERFERLLIEMQK